MQPSMPLIGKGIMVLTSASFDMPQVLKTLMIRPHPKSMKSESVNVGPRHHVGDANVLPRLEMTAPEGWPHATWRMVQAHDHKPEKGCREAEACSKNSDQKSEESALRYKALAKDMEKRRLGGV